MPNITLGPHIFSCILDVEFSISSVIPLFLEDAIRCVGYIPNQKIMHITWYVEVILVFIPVP